MNPFKNLLKDVDLFSREKTSTYMQTHTKFAYNSQGFMDSSEHDFRFQHESNWFKKVDDYLHIGTDTRSWVESQDEGEIKWHWFF